jgi:hypothetical protein
MTNEFAIAAVTLTLRNLLEPVKELSDASVIGSFPVDIAPTAEIVVNNLPLDEAYDFDNAKNQVNIFLYHVEHSANWRNMEIPGKTKNGESGHPPLGLNLYYIITAYGQNNNEIIGHLLLGKAMSILHDHPVFSRQEIQIAFPDSFLHEQIERVRITPQPISLDDISKLWTGFQTQYKLSVAYQASVVLIESKRPTRTPLPVLTRGADDKGVFVQPYVIPPFPTLEAVQYPGRQHGVQLGDELLMKGHHLKGDTVDIKFRHLPTGIENTRLASSTPSDKEIRFIIPNGGPGIWPPGPYSASAIIHKTGEPDKTSNAIGFMLLPTIIVPITIAPLSPFVPKGFEATITFTPAIEPTQKASLLLGDKEFKSKDHPVSTTVLSFEMRNVDAGDYFIRLRIDGADSLLIIDSVTPPVFNPAFKVTIV